MAAERKRGVPSEDFGALMAAQKRGTVVLVCWCIDGILVHLEVQKDEEDAVDAARDIQRSDAWKEYGNKGHYQTLTGHPFDKEGNIQRDGTIFLGATGEAMVTWVRPDRAPAEQEEVQPKTRRKPQAAKSTAKQTTRKPAARKAATTRKPTAKKTTTARKRTTAAPKRRGKPGRK